MLRHAIRMFCQIPNQNPHFLKKITRPYSHKIIIGLASTTLTLMLAYGSNKVFFSNHYIK